MKKIATALFTVILALGLSLGDAQAARLGGGKSVGMQRQSVSARPATPAQQASAAPAPTGAPAVAPKRNWMGPLAGLAAGLGIAALLSHFGMGEGMSNVLMIALLAMVAVFAVKWLLRRNASAASPGHALQYAGATGSREPSMVAVPPFGSAASSVVPSVVQVPEGFDSEGFLRIAKLNFVRLQASNDARSIDDIREFVAPEVFAEIKLQMDERGDTPQQTDVVTLNAELLEVATEVQRHVASVRFSGMIRERVGVAAQPFEEVWNLSKPIAGGAGWVICGIQQLR